MSNKKTYSYEYARPAITVDCVIFGFDKNELKVLLTKRAIEPYISDWAFPGGFINDNETADDCAVRKLHEEAGLKDVFMEQLYTFSNLNRDPRERVISIAYYALVRSTDLITQAGINIEDVQWFSLQNLPKLAFDHSEILTVAIRRLKGKIRYQPIGFELLPEQFTLPELHRLYETILQKDIERANFRKKILSMGVLIDLSTQQKNRKAREAKLYAFDNDKYHNLVEIGWNFEV